MKIVTRVALALFLGISMAACGGGDDGGNPDAPPAGPDANTAPSVAATPDVTTVAAGGDVVLTITATNFTLVDFSTAPPNAPGEGHYHVYLDNETGANYLAADFMGTTTVTIPAATAAGAHTLKVQLFENDHMPLAPEVSTVVNITVQ